MSQTLSVVRLDLWKKCNTYLLLCYSYGIILHVLGSFCQLYMPNFLSTDKYFLQHKFHRNKRNKESKRENFVRNKFLKSPTAWASEIVYCDRNVHDHDVQVG